MSASEKCPEHGSTLGVQDVMRVVVDKNLPYPRPRLWSTEGDGTEIECPYCGLANDLSDGDGIISGGGDFECGHCGLSFDFELVAVIVRTSAYEDQKRIALEGCGA